MKLHILLNISLLQLVVMLSISPDLSLTAFCFLVVICLLVTGKSLINTLPSGVKIDYALDPKNSSCENTIL